MTQIRRSVPAALVFMTIVVMLSACTQSLSSAPAEAPTAIPTGLFVSPIASVENPMELIEQFAKQTEAAQTAAAGGGTPATTGTPDAGATSTNDPAALVATPTATIAIATPTNANTVATTPVTAATSVPPVIASGSEYILHEGEYPYCIARRYNVDPEALLKASGLTSPDIYYPGLKLIIPQAGPFPGPRSLKPHPASYTVASGNETIYSISCLFGDADPVAIASTNGLSSAATLTIGQVLQIP